MSEIVEKLTNHIKKSPFREMVGFNIEHIAKGELDASVELLPLFQRHDGLAHGGFLAYFADTLMGLSSLTTLDMDTQTVFTAEMKVSYMKPGMGSRLRGEGRVLKQGKRIIFTEAQIFGFDSDGKEYLVCKSSGTMCASQKVK